MDDAIFVDDDWDDGLNNLGIGFCIFIDNEDDVDDLVRVGANLTLCGWNATYVILLVLVLVVLVVLVALVV